jgi:hypothetical protein
MRARVHGHRRELELKPGRALAASRSAAGRSVELLHSLRPGVEEVGWTAQQGTRGGHPRAYPRRGTRRWKAPVNGQAKRHAIVVVYHKLGPVGPSGLMLG